MNYNHHTTAPAPNAPMRRGRSVRMGVPALTCRGIPGQGKTFRLGRDSMTETGV